MTFDDQIRHAVDRATAGLRAHFDAELAALVEEIARAANTERAREVQQKTEAVASDVRRQADAQIAQLRENAYKQTEDIKRAAETQVIELRKTMQAQLEEARKVAQSQIEQTRRTASEETENSRRAAQQEVNDARRLAEAQVEEARRVATAQLDDLERQTEARIADIRRDAGAALEETDRRARAELEAARAEAEAARETAQAEAEEIVIAQLAAAQTDAERKTADAVDRTRTDAYQAELAHATRLVDAIRTLDDARALGELLDALAECAGREVNRAAVLVIKGEKLRGWRLAGFPDAGPAKNIEMTLDEAGLAGAVVRTGVTVSRPTVTPDALDTRQPALPPFAQHAGTRHAMALPILVGGRVVAVLYADSPREDAPSAASRWPAVLEVVVRHASRALEAMTVQQATGLSLPRPAPRPSHGALPGPIDHGGTGDDDAARRYARLLVSEIRLYHEPVVDAGRRSRDLRTRLRDEIDRARALYEARVPPAVRDRSDYFEQELVRTLADGDRTLLG